MDVSKLDKMKVVELRAELTARGLDAKGVKAVLVERLKAAIEDGDQTTEVTETESSGNPPETPVPATPSRRHRRTRSITRSPSPPKRADPVLEVLTEEPQVEGGMTKDEPIPIESSSEKSRKSEKHTTSPEKQRQKTPVAVTPEKKTEVKDTPKKTEVKETPKKEASRKSRTSQTPEKVTPKKSSRKMSPDKVKTLEEPMEQDEPLETKEDKVEAIVQSREVIPTEEPESEPPPSPKPMESEEQKAPEVPEESKTEKAEPKQDESNKPEDSGDNENVTNQASSQSESNLDEVSQDTSLNRKLSTEDDKSSVHTEKRAKKRKRSHSRSRSRSRSRDPHSRSRSDSRSKSRSRSKSSSRSRKSKSERQSKSRSRSRSKGPKSKTFTAEELKGFGFMNEEDEPSIEDKVVGLSWFDSDLHLRIDPVSFVSAKPISDDALALAWSGVRTTYGVKDGKIAYEVRLSEESNVSHLRGEEHLRAFRCGFSTTKGNLMLGQNENSFAFCYTGKKCSNGECADYGKPYGLDDVIGCYLNLDESPCKIEFTLNGAPLGTAFEFEKSSLGEEALFPHILTKGYEFQVNFADNDNLLANVVKPKREKKVVEPEPVEVLKQPEDTCEEKWDEDEPMQPAKQPEKDESKDKSEANGESVETSDTKDDAEMKDVEEKDEEMKDVQSEEKKENNEEEKKEENVNSKENDESESKPEQDEQKDCEDKQEAQAAETEPEVREPVHLLPDYKLIGLVDEDSLISGLQRPEKREECEVILMVGLPNSGKTYWAQKHAKEHPDKMYNIIGFEGIYDKMKVDGQPRKSVHKGNWERFHELCEKSFTLLEEIAAKRRRNYILDQVVLMVTVNFIERLRNPYNIFIVTSNLFSKIHTVYPNHKTNVYASCQRRKMKGFGDFKRIAVICIPREDELKRRNELKTEEHGSNLINESTLNKMKANFTLPSAEFCWFDEVRYVDLDEEESKKEVKKYNSKAMSVRSDRSSSGGYKRPRMDNYRRDRPRQDDRRRDDNRGSRWGNDRRGQGQNRWGPQGGGGGGSGGRGGGHWRDDRGYGGGGGIGGGGYDRRDNRYGGGVNNWAHNPRPPRYDDRGYRPAPSGGGGGGGNRYDYGGSRDRYDRDRNGSGGGRRDSYHRGSNQRDFRAGHRDHRTEDSRGGYDRSSTKYAKDDYEYKANRAGSNGSKSTNKQSSANQNSYGSQQANWNMSASQHQTSGGYWGYDAMHQSYSAPPSQQQQPPPQQQQQQHWQMNSADPRQQQQWMSWWNQQQADPQQYWSQYPQHAYVHQPTSSHGDVASSMPKGANMGGGNRSSESKKP